MKLLLDTHLVLGLLRQDFPTKYPRHFAAFSEPTTIGFVSVASLWEMAIKTRIGKLDLGIPLGAIAGFLDAVGLTILSIETAHVVTIAEPSPETRDPFDRLLLAQCRVEGLKLATIDQALVAHPLAWRP